MIESPQNIIEEPPSSWVMARTLSGIGIICAILIAVVYQTTLPVIQRNKNEALENAIYRVLPGTRKTGKFVFVDDNFFHPGDPSTENGLIIYAGYDKQDALTGVAIEAHGNGYQDVIRILYGYSPDKQAVVGMEILESKETPGLGDKIGRDPEFLKNFDALDVRLDTSKDQLLNSIKMVKKGKKMELWQIDAISGATISSKAVAEILRTSTAIWIPRVTANLDKLKGVNDEH